MIWAALAGWWRKATTAHGGLPVPPELAEAELPESVVRARSMVGKGYYCLGAGGRDRHAATPLGACAKPKEHTHGKYGHIFSDCSGFVAWCVERPRVVDLDPGPGKDEVWFYTDALEADARGKVKGDLGDGVPWHKAQPGDLIVYGAGPAVGHIGIVSEVDDAGPVKVIHCHGGKAPAITETSPDVFERHGAVILRLR